jgi:hypothetical protein
MAEFWTGYELDFAIDLLVSLAAGFTIGAEKRGERDCSYRYPIEHIRD